LLLNTFHAFPSCTNQAFKLLQFLADSGHGLRDLKRPKVEQVACRIGNRGGGYLRFPEG